MSRPKMNVANLFLDHPDFSLIPNPENPAVFRGVAHTYEGINALVALWGVPLDDPDHRLCVFSWSPTPDALGVLKTHFPETRLCPLWDRTEHHTRWEAQKGRAWLTSPATPSRLDIEVTDVQQKAATSLTVFFEEDDVTWNQKECPLQRLSVWGNPDCDAFLWGSPLFQGRFRLEETELTPVLRHTLWSCVSPEWIFRDGPFLKAYRSAQTGDLPVVSFREVVQVWATPLFVRTVRDFLQHLKGAFPTPSSIYPLRGMSPVWHPLFRQAMCALPRSDLETIWKTGRLKGFLEDDEIAMACPAEWFSEALHHGRLSDKKAALLTFKTALQSDDTFFFDRLRDVNVASGRGLLDQTEEGVALYRLWDRVEGFETRGTMEGVARFAASFSEGDFSKAMTGGHTMSVRMSEAFEDAAFLTALGKTPFWTTLEKAPRRHPEWEALLEKRLLHALWSPPDVTSPAPHEKSY
jgi:hypothetical protein